MDYSSVTNIIISAAAGAAFVGGLAVQLALRAPVWDSFVWGFSFGIGVFLAWALGREIDPEYDISALAAAALAIPGMIVFGVPAILAGFWILVTLRIVVRTAGPKPGALDTGLVTALALWLSYRYSWFYGGAAALFLLFDALIKPRSKLSLVFTGVSAAGTALIALFLVDRAGTFALSRVMGIFILALIGAVIFLISSEGSLSVRSDDGSHPLSLARLRAAQAGSLILLILLLYQTGLAGLTDQIPLLAAFAGAVLYRPVGIIRRRLEPAGRA